jgi:DNA/RNA endonuclease YhcR with UshA esterase domain
MRCVLTLVAVLVSINLAVAQEDEKPITADEALNKVGEKVVVQMEVKSTGSSRATQYLNSLVDFKDRNNLTIVIFRSDLNRFKKAEIDDPTEHYKGKTIQVTGTVSVFNRQVQIKVNDPEQIKIIDTEAEAPKPKAPAKTVKGKGGKPK